MFDILTEVAWKELRKIDIGVENENLHHISCAENLMLFMTVI